MTDLLDVLSRLDPVPVSPRYDDATVRAHVTAIVTAVPPSEANAIVSPVSAARNAVTDDRRWRQRRPTGRRVAIGAVALLAVAIVVLTVGVSVGWLPPLAGRANPALDAGELFPVDVEPSTITRQLSVPTSDGGDLALWSATSPAVGHCLLVIGGAGAWPAAVGLERAWRPNGPAACLDNQIGDSAIGAGLSARFLSQDGTEAVYAAHVTVPSGPSVVTDSAGRRSMADDKGPASNVVTSAAVTVTGRAVQAATVDHGWLLTPPQPTNACVTVAASNSAGRVVSTDVVTPDCPGAFEPPAPAVAGSTAAPIVANNWNYPDGLLVGFSALRQRPLELIATQDPDVTVLTLSVQFTDQCELAAGGTAPYPDPCHAVPIPLPSELRLTLTYGASQTEAAIDIGRPDPHNDFNSGPMPGYVGGKLTAVLVYATFDVPTDQLTQLTAHWGGDALHAPRVMTGLEKGIT